MKTKLTTGLFLAAIALALAVLSPQRASAQALDLAPLTSGGSGVYTNTFDLMGHGNPLTNADSSSGTLSGEWVCYTNAAATRPGTIVAGSAAPNSTSSGFSATFTNTFAGRFHNFPSYFDYVGGTNFAANGSSTFAIFGASGTANATSNQQFLTNEPNRCLGVRQTGTFGDPGAAIVLKLANTLAYDDFKMTVDLINLDPTSPRQQIWTVDYGVPDPVIGIPASFVPLATFTNVPGKFHWTNATYNFPNGSINNVDGQVWLRFAALGSTTGSGNRESFAIDNVGLTWDVGTAPCTPVTNNPLQGPNDTTVYTNGQAVFQVNATGTFPTFYQWRYNGVDVSASFPGQVGNSYRSFQLNVNNCTAANAGSYDCIVSNACNGTVYIATSQVAVLTVTNAPEVTIGYLRTLVDPTQGYAPTNGSLFYRATGIITVATNLIAAGNGTSYYLQDATAGINLFITGGTASAFHPALGDEVTAVGFLNVFSGNLEFEVDLSGGTPANNATSVQTLTNNIANYPVAKVLSWPNEFNNQYGIGVTNPVTEYTKKGAICMLTNVYFGTNAGRVLTTNAAVEIVITNTGGQTGWIQFPTTTASNLAPNALPGFAYSIQGQFIATDSSANFTNQWNVIQVARFADIVTNALTLNITRSSTTSTITWTAVPLTYSYSVLASANAVGPYTPIATNLKFSTSAASYLDVNASERQFYRVTSP